MKKIISLVLVVAHLFLLFPVVSLDIGAESEQWDVINTKGITGEDIVAQAKKYIGAGYSNKDYKTRTGFTTPQKFDCSGLVYRVCREVGLVSSHQNSTMGVYDDAGRPLEGSNEAGYYITAHTGKQKNYGTKLTTAVNNYKESGDYSGFLPGDLLFFDYKSNGTGGTDHVGIYTANGKIINATSSKGVVETSLSQTGWPDGKLGNSLYDAVRLVNSNEAANSYLSKCTAYPTHVTIKTTKSTYVKSLPCSEKTDANSENVETANAGIQYEAIGLYKNTAGNLWYKVCAKNGSVGYIYAGDAAFVSEDTSDIVHSGITVPTSHTKGNSYPLTGTISSTYSKIDKISVYVYDAKGTKITGAEATVTGNNYTLKGSAIDNKTKFGTLAVGAHTYKVTVYFEYCYADSAKDMTTWSLALPLYEKTFNVAGNTSCSHSYSGKVTTAATCATAGVRTYTCSKCNDSYTETIAATGNHTYDNACDKDCNVCGATRTTSHSWNNGQVTKVATCKEEGVKTFTCTVCGEKKTESIAKTTNHTYDNACDKDCNVCGATRTTSHTWNNGEVTKEPTCKEEGVKTYTCTGCGETKVEAVAKLTTHTWNDGEITIQATCSSYGQKFFTCSVCGNTKTESYTDSRAHQYDGRDDDHCNLCNQFRLIGCVGETLGVQITTKTDKGYTLTGSGSEFATVVFTGQSSIVIGSSGTYKKNYNLTFSKAGTYELLFVQEGTGSRTAFFTEITEHEWEFNKTVQPTCAQGGYDIYKCKHCGTTEQRNEVGANGAHTWNNGTVTKEPTCKEEGVKTFTCTVCGERKTESIAKTTNHTYDNACDKDCNVCGTTRTTSHTWNNGEVTKEPTCKEEGVKTFTCSVCGETKTEAIAKTNDHTYDNACDKNCNVCGATRTVTHAFSTQWDKDGNGHWHTCTICGEKGGHAVHTPGAPATETTAQTCTICEYVIQKPLGPSYAPGDVDGVEGINDADAIYLLYSIFMPELYPVNQDCDFDGDGELTDRDAIYLLYHIFLPEQYPIG